MAQSGQRKCLCCGEFFDIDHRNRHRQRYCSAAPCRRASKTFSQAVWLSQPQNKYCFSDPVHVARVQAWRTAHPGYSRAKPGTTKPLQDSLIAQVVDSVEETSIRTETPAPPAISALQDDIASTTRRLIQLGHDVINRSRNEDRQTCAAP